MTKEQLRSLKPGDKLTVVDSPFVESFLRGKPLTVADPFFVLEIDGVLFIRVNEEDLTFRGDLLFSEMFAYFNVELYERRCDCDIVQLMIRGCSCGGI
jgi:hypothetical protein